MVLTQDRKEPKDEEVNSIVNQILLSIPREYSSPTVSGITMKEWKKIYETSPYLIQVFNYFMLVHTFPNDWEP
jgi:hypothetical protein